MGGKLFAAVSVCMLVTMGFCAPVKRRSGLYVCEGAGNPGKLIVYALLQLHEYNTVLCDALMRGKIIL